MPPSKLAASANVERNAAVGCLFGVHDIADIDAIIVELVCQRPIGINGSLNGVDSALGTLEDGARAGAFVVEVVPVIDGLERLFDALCAIHAKAFSLADAGKCEGGESGGNGDFSKAVHDGILSSAAAVGCQQGIVCVTTEIWRCSIVLSMD
jgi:hypothetical protein